MKVDLTDAMAGLAAIMRLARPRSASAPEHGVLSGVAAIMLLVVLAGS